MSGDFERDFDDLESLESDLNFLDLLLSSLLDLDFFDRERDLECDLGDLDLLRRNFERSWDRDLDLLDLDLDLDRRDLDLDRDLLDFEGGERERRDFESRLGDFDLDFLERFMGDLDRDLDFFALSRESGDGVRLFFFFPSAMLINLACNLEIATAASGLVLTGINGIAFSGCGESSRSILTSGMSLPLSLSEFLLGDLDDDRRLRLDRSRSRCRSLDLLLLFLSLSRSLLRSLRRSFEEPRSFSSFFILFSASSFSFSRSFSFSFSANEAWSFSCSSKRFLI